MHQFNAKIILNQKIAPNHYKLSFKTPRIARETIPGQFFNIRVSNSYHPLLRRPLAAHKIERDRIELLYKVVGEATKILSAKNKGDMLDIIGPIGNGFDVPPEARVAILVAGGHGVAPLVALAKKVAISNLKVITFLGARTKEHIVCEEDFRRLGVKVYVATEDGSKGYKGLVTDLVECHCEALTLKMSRLKQSQRLLRRAYGAPRNDGSMIYACGPKPMLETIARLAEHRKIPCQVSLEEHIACGFGACLSCAVKTEKGYKLVCKDGPIFDSREIVW